MIPKKDSLRFDIRIFTSTVALLIIIGLLFIYSASSVYALEKFKNAHYYLQRHGIGIALGLIAVIVIRFIPLTRIKKTAPLFFWGALALTLLSKLSPFAVHIHGSTRWMKLGGMVFQPSELLKIAFIMYYAYLLSKNELRINSLVKTYIPLIVVLIITSLTLLNQPDFGMTVACATTACALMFIAHIPYRYLAATLATAIPVGITLVLLKPYRLKRVLTFLNPWSDPQGAGFQIIQSLIAIGSGGLWGVGVSNSEQKFFYLPMQHTDFIFSIIAEETGFIGALGLIGLYLTFLYVGIKVAWQLHDKFATYTTLGFIIMTNLQVIINLAVAIGIAPTKGVGLPFISYGNTALIGNFIMIGFIINAAHKARATTSHVAPL